MCGIAGFLAPRIEASAARAQLRSITDSITHRGPDGSGAWVDGEAGVALGHRRLAIIDLSEAGHQPMVSPSGRFILTYNGEVYNHRDLRAELEASGAVNVWRGHSDTEVIAAGFDRWGVPGTLERLNGMFALAVWDRRERMLVLARDRLGEKPLYYGRMGEAFLFGSELKALTHHPAFIREVDREALTLFFRYNYVPAPHSIWRGIAKLKPGHYVEIRECGRSIGTPIPFWNFRSVAEAGVSNPLRDAPERRDELETLLKDAVGRRMEADVPLGAFLSGGIDSSLVVALMQSQSRRPVRTFTIGFDDPSANEAEHANEVAAHLGTDHTELYLTGDDALSIVPRLPEIWDEPFADSSQIPTFLVSRLTRRHVTVALSGDGGDEVFGGYNRYFLAARFRALGKRLGPGGRRLVAAITRSARGRSAVARLMQAMPQRHRHLGAFDRLHKIANIIEAGSDDEVYDRLVSQAQEPGELVVGGAEPRARTAAVSMDDLSARMMYLDTLTYLPDDILTKVDRASMAVSLEVRAPFLDHRLVEYAWRLPMSAKVAGGRGKLILRDILDRYVPRRLIDRPKAGFGVPLGGWLNGPLREWSEDLLGEARLRAGGYLEPEAVGKAWSDYRRRGGQPHLIWTLLMFQAWLAEQQEPAPSPEAHAVHLTNV